MDYSRWSHAFNNMLSALLMYTGRGKGVFMLFFFVFKFNAVLFFL